MVDGVGLAGDGQSARARSGARVGCDRIIGGTTAGAAARCGDPGHTARGGPSAARQCGDRHAASATSGGESPTGRRNRVSASRATLSDSQGLSGDGQGACARRGGGVRRDRIAGGTAAGAAARRGDPGRTARGGPSAARTGGDTHAAIATRGCERPAAC